MNLNKEQQAIVDANESFIVVNAAAGSGKTTVLTERMKRIISEGTPTNQIVAITFTNNAAEELRERIGSAGDGAFIGTVHAYANYLLLSNGVDTKKLLEEENFDGLFHLVKEHPHCIKHVQYLFLDEAQDSTSQQFEFLLDMVISEHWMLVGDQRQSIYRFASAAPERFIELQHQSYVKTYYLRNNYRCGTKILDYARGIIHLAGYDYEDNSVPLSGKLGVVQDVEYNANTIAKAIKNYGHDWKDWFVLCRTNDEIDYFCRVLDIYDVPHDTFKRKDLSNKDLKQKMAENTVKVLTIHAAKGLEARDVVVIGGRFYNTEEKCVSYVAATRAKELLVWARIPHGKKKYTKNYHIPMSNWE